MLEKIYIQNFQCHSKLKIEFDPHITVITGSSDIGKSATLRALRWVCQNHPQGDQFIKDGTKGTTVKLIVDGKEIIRRRGKGQNAYLLDKKVYKAFGTDVPDAIKNTLNLNEVNFSNQHDSSFWFSLSAGEVSRQLNSIVDLGIIDSSLSAIGKKVRHTQQTIQICKERLLKAEDRKDKVNWIIEADIDYIDIESFQGKYQELNNNVLALRDTIESSMSYLKVHDTASSQVRDIRSVGKLGQNCINLSKKRSTLSTILRDSKEQNKVLKAGIPDTEKLVSAFEKCNPISIKRMNLRSMIQDSDDLQVEVEIHSSYLKKVEKELHKATEGICPICGRKM